MEATPIREEVYAFMQASQAFAEFAEHNGLSNTERQAIEYFVETLGPQPSLTPSPLEATLSNVSLID